MRESSLLVASDFHLRDDVPRCRKCGRQLKHAASLLRGMGKHCAGESSHLFTVVRSKRESAGHGNQSGLFDEPIQGTGKSTEGGGEPIEIIDFDVLRTNIDRMRNTV